MEQREISTVATYDLNDFDMEVLEAITESFGEILKNMGGPNCLSFTLHHKRIGKFYVEFRYAEGKTMNEVNEDLHNRIAELEAWQKEAVDALGTIWREGFVYMPLIDELLAKAEEPSDE